MKRLGGRCGRSLMLAEITCLLESATSGACARRCPPRFPAELQAFDFGRRELQRRTKCVCCFQSRRMDLERGERPPPRGRQMVSSRHLLWSWLLLLRLGAPDLSPRVCLCKEFHHQGHEAEENGAPKKPLSHFGLKDVAQRRRSRSSQEAE